MSRQLDEKRMNANKKINDFVVRFNEMQPCKTAFIDSNTPGSENKENFCLIGAGVSENPNQFVHIQTPHGFNIGGARQPAGCKNSHHSHDTEEVFAVQSGTWEFTWGNKGEDGKTILTKGDVISIPSHLFRGFENVGEEDDAFMFSVLGLDAHGSAGQVLWAPYVFDEAKEHGLVLLEDGQLLNPRAGDIVPDNAPRMPKTTPEQVSNLKRLSLADMTNCVAIRSNLETLATGGLTGPGVTEYAVIGQKNESENIDSGQMDWSHGFHLRRIHINPQTTIKPHTRNEEEVIIVHKGSLVINMLDEDTLLNTGDVATVPVECTRTFSNPGNDVLELFVIRGGDHPKSARFIDANDE